MSNCNDKTVLSQNSHVSIEYSTIPLYLKTSYEWV